MYGERIEIERQIDELTRDIWVFVYFEGVRLVLDLYRRETRQSKRHKYQIEKRYNRLSERSSEITEDEAPLPDDVQAEVIQQFVAKLAVVRWTQYKRDVGRD